MRCQWKVVCANKCWVNLIIQCVATCSGKCAYGVVINNWIQERSHPSTPAKIEELCRLSFNQFVRRSTKRAGSSYQRQPRLYTLRYYATLQYCEYHKQLNNATKMNRINQNEHNRNFLERGVFLKQTPESGHVSKYPLMHGI